MCRSNFYDTGIYSCQLEFKNTFKFLFENVHESDLQTEQTFYFSLTYCIIKSIIQVWDDKNDKDRSTKRKESNNKKYFFIGDGWKIVFKNIVNVLRNQNQKL